MNNHILKENKFPILDEGTCDTRVILIGWRSGPCTNIGNSIQFIVLCDDVCK